MPLSKLVFKVSTEIKLTTLQKADGLKLSGYGFVQVFQKKWVGGKLETLSLMTALLEVFFLGVQQIVIFY
jgi:hypothetical protein